MTLHIEVWVRQEREALLVAAARMKRADISGQKLASRG
jgi:hypothetical protein